MFNFAAFTQGIKIPLNPPSKGDVFFKFSLNSDLFALRLGFSLQGLSTCHRRTDQTPQPTDSARLMHSITCPKPRKSRLERLIPEGECSILQEKCPISEGKCLIPEGEYPIPRREMPHSSREMPHCSRKMPHYSREMPHSSRGMPHSLKEKCLISRREMPHFRRETPHCSWGIPHFLTHTAPFSGSNTWDKRTREYLLQRADRIQPPSRLYGGLL